MIEYRTGYRSKRMKMILNHSDGSSKRIMNNEDWANIVHSDRISLVFTKILLLSPDGISQSKNVYSNETISYIQNLAAETIGVHPMAIKLSWQGTELSNTITIDQLGVQDNDTILITIDKSLSPYSGNEDEDEKILVIPLIQIIIIAPDGKPHVMEISPEETPEDIEKFILDTLGYPSTAYRLVCEGKELIHGCLLRSQGVKEESNVHITIRSLGGHTLEISLLYGAKSLSMTVMEGQSEESIIKQFLITATSSGLTLPENASEHWMILDNNRKRLEKIKQETSIRIVPRSFISDSKTIADNSGSMPITKNYIRIWISGWFRWCEIPAEVWRANIDRIMMESSAGRKYLRDDKNERYLILEEDEEKCIEANVSNEHEVN